MATLAKQRGTRPPRKEYRELESDLRRAIQGEVRFDAGSRALYATDASNYRQVPIGVVVPRSTEDVVRTVAACRRHGAPIVSRGGGTSLAGQTCNVAVVMDFSKYVNSIVRIDPESGTARVQPGVVLDNLNHETESAHQLIFGPDPSTHGWCTLGGMIGNNSCGVHSVMAGRTVDNVEEMEVLTYDGLRMRVGRTSDEALDAMVAAGGRRGEIYKGLREIRDEFATLIRSRYPDIPRRVSGYNLDELLPERGFNVARALVGTEGTCVTVLDATLKLVHSPPARSLLVLGYPDVYAAGDHVPEILEHKPVGLEGLDDALISFMRKKHMHPNDVDLLPPGGGWLLIEFGGENKEESDARAHELVERLRGERDAPSMKLFNDPEVEQQIWHIRESGLGATAHVPGMHDTGPGWEDAAVDPAQLGDYLRDFRALLDEYGYHASLYGHFGQACIHCRIDFDLLTQSGVDTYRRFLDAASDLVLEYGGSFSGEHGDGQSRASLLPKMYGPELMQAMRKFKQLWDPEWKMNPGKVIEPNPPDADLRMGTDYSPASPGTNFSFTTDDGSIARAAARCVGVGKCRRTDDAFMCPSYLVTHEERDSTRGRARLLFEMLRGDVLSEGWRSSAVHDALDLCLGCKGCKTDCPVNVDMATYKAEFLSHYYHHRMRPRSFYAMGWIEYTARIASAAPRLANFFSHNAPFSQILKRVAGVSTKRHMPRFAPETFSRWHKRRGLAANPDGPPVLLLPDVFSDHFHPESLKAAVHVLEYAGYGVRVPSRAFPAMRPLLHYGFLRPAQHRMKYAVELLRPFAREGIPIIGLEPSTVAVLRDELINMMPHDQDARRIAQVTRLFSEFLDGEDIPLPSVPRQAILHVHCHQRADLDFDATQRVLKRMDVDFTVPEVGCCGLAGAFGFEADHYDVSMAIAERRLFPAVRAAEPDALLIADGFSCRAQILEGTGRHAHHLAEVIANAIEHDGEPESIAVRREPQLEWRTS